MHIKSYDELFFTDDFMFCKVMQDESICRRVIKVLLGIDAEKLTYVNTQESIKADYESHGVRLDVIAKSDGRNYDIEMQTVLKGSLPKRARYYQAMMDISSLKKSDEYSVLPESYVVFICLNDPFGLEEPRYTAKLQCLENPLANEKIDDKALKVYYNSKAWEHLAENDAEVRAFLKFLNTQKAEDKLTEDIMEAVRIARLREPWRVEYMQTRERYREARAEGLAEGRAEGLAKGLAEGLATGRAEGLAAGRAKGLAEGRAEGLVAGRAEGLAEGLAEGRAKGHTEGLAEGRAEQLAEDKIIISQKDALLEQSAARIAVLEERLKKLEGTLL